MFEGRGQWTQKHIKANLLKETTQKEVEAHKRVL
jgi:hypothetical protein